MLNPNLEHFFAHISKTLRSFVIKNFTLELQEFEKLKEQLTTMSMNDLGYFVN